MNHYSSNQAKKGKISSHNRNDSSSTLSEEENYPQKSQKAYSTKYKTQICKKWEQGKCTFKEKCIFAHGKHELRKDLSSKENTSSSRAKKCIPFFEKGYCVYGSKCLFSHEEDEQTILQRQKRKEKENDVEEIESITKMIQSDLSRIPLFIDLERRNIY